MVSAYIPWIEVAETWRRCRERWQEAGLSFQRLLALAPPAITEAFWAWVAGLGSAVVVGILCTHMLNSARQWAVGFGELVPVRAWGRLR